MARKSTTAANDTTTTGAKVGKVTKGAKPAAKSSKAVAASEQAPAKRTRKADAAPATTQQARTGRKSQFAGMSIRNLVPKGETPCRGGALVRFETIVSHKRVDDAIGAEYSDNGETRTINAADIAYLVKRELIEVV